MNHTTLLVGLVLTLGIPLAATLPSTFTVNAQQLSSSPSSSMPRTTTISESLKSEMCDPSNPSLKVVNTTEARICGIPKTVKDPITTPTPISTTASPSTTPTESKPSSITQASSSSSPKEQQQVVTTNNNNNTRISESNSPAISASTTPTSSVSTELPLASTPTTPTTTIAPQAGSEIVQNPIDQQQQPPILAAVSNGTDAQNTALASISPLLSSDKLMYLGYHVGAGGTSGEDSTGKSIKTSSSSKDNGAGGTSGEDSTGKSIKTSSSSKDNGSTHKRDSSTKSSSHDSDKSKSKPSSQSKSRNDHDGSGDKKPKKSSSKEHKGHKGGDSFFGGDPFF